MLELTSRVYKNNAKQSFLTDNAFNTVNIHPISNLAADATVFHTEDVTTVQLGDSVHSLPLDVNIAPTHMRTVNNSRWLSVIIGTKECAKSRIDCVMISGTTRCTVSSVIQGTPTVNIVLTGTSEIVERGGSSYSNYPAISSLDNKLWSLANWINSNKTTTQNNFTLDYTQGNFSMNPWVRNVVSINGDRDPVANDVLTEWVGTETFWERYYAWWDNWVDNSDFNTGAYTQFEMHSPNAITIGDYEDKFGSRLKMYNMYLPIKKSVTKIDDYTYDVEWSVPVRVAYAAASQGIGGLGGTHDVDNLAFCDRVSNISLQLSGVPYDTSVKDLSYTLNDSGELVEATSSMGKIIDIDAGEALTLESFYSRWNEDLQHSVKEVLTEKMAKELLTKYKNGKYVFTCDVSAQWALKNSVHIATRVYLRLPDGSLFQRKGTTCTFVVKNITKIYSADEFVYRLSLLEA